MPVDLQGQKRPFSLSGAKLTAAPLSGAQRIELAEAIAEATWN